MYNIIIIIIIINMPVKRYTTREKASALTVVVVVDVLLQDSLIEMIRRTRIHFVHCLLPQYNAGLCDLRTANQSPREPGHMEASVDGGGGASAAEEEVVLSVPFVRSQLRGSEALEAIRIHRQGRIVALLLFNKQAEYDTWLFCSLNHKQVMVDKPI